MIEYIGNVKLDLTYYSGQDLYSDGDIEEEILKIVKENDDYDKILEIDTRWPVLYHLSPIRRNLIDSFYFENNEKVLEIGAGCGAITSVLSEKFKRVDCIELSKKRSIINGYKNKKSQNINIYVGNFQDVKINEKYDLITLIGVWEYSELYINSSTPFKDMILRLKELLNKDGKMLIAIENKFGLKYWAGCREDHTGNFFQGIEGYVLGNKVKTFSYNEIVEILKACKCENYKMYYPFPDYKFPSSIYSDDRLPDIGELRSNLANYDMSRVVLFEESNTFDNIIKSNYFNIFANSFLVEVYNR